jgi:hypothetical protein
VIERHDRAGLVYPRLNYTSARGSKTGLGIISV